jgi:hypothetical protein
VAHTEVADGSRIVVLDIDGVIADVRHRLHYLAQRPKDWAAFFAAAADDPVLEIGADFAHKAATTHRIVYLTGRPERLRRATSAWLDAHQLPPGPLIMRRDGDRRPGAVIKVHELRRLRGESPVDLLVDDDETVLEAARSAGFNVHHADWMPRQALATGETNDTSGTNDSALFGVDLLTQAQEQDGRT